MVNHFVAKGGGRGLLPPNSHKWLLISFGMVAAARNFGDKLGQP